ncbi:hypothetical protein BD410DRAFT_795054 [Rickenella mellea]|uniref:Secreted protein n=1 Tax=Rickenella mellea TaxID=50990 RepID=A0A4Y7PMW9_9AGAM|nr:hypothetical protein BD410DRAFT_795054 [Rickenella mellea]
MVCRLLLLDMFCRLSSGSAMNARYGLHNNRRLRFGVQWIAPEGGWSEMITAALLIGHAVDVHRGQIWFCDNGNPSPELWENTTL